MQKISFEPSQCASGVMPVVLITHKYGHSTWGFDRLAISWWTTHSIVVDNGPKCANACNCSAMMSTWWLSSSSIISEEKAILTENHIFITFSHVLLKGKEIINIDNLMTFIVILKICWLYCCILCMLLANGNDWLLENGNSKWWNIVCKSSLTIKLSCFILVLWRSDADGWSCDWGRRFPEPQSIGRMLEWSWVRGGISGGGGDVEGWMFGHAQEETTPVGLSAEPAPE